MSPDKWGIVFCPKASLITPRRQWLRIERELDARGIAYDYLQSERADSVPRLVRMLIDSGHTTIIIAGGDTALCHAANCLMELTPDKRRQVALGVIPNGGVNDFARYWGFQAGSIGQTIDWLAKRRVRPIDLGRIDYDDKQGQTHRRYFLNCICIGLSADIIGLRRQARSILGLNALSFLASAIVMLFHRMEYKMDLAFNTEHIRRRIMTVCVGSARGYGQTPNAVPYNGRLDLSIVYHPEVVQLIAGLWHMLTGRFLGHRCVKAYRTTEVRIAEAKHAMIAIDGQVAPKPKGPYRISIEKEVIGFLIPD